MPSIGYGLNSRWSMTLNSAALGPMARASESTPSSPTVTARPRFMTGVAVTAARQASRIFSRCAGFAQPGNGWPERFRASRIRVMSTMADLLLAESVNSDGVSISDAIVIGSSQLLLVDGLSDLADFIAAACSVLVALRLDRLAEVDLELCEPVVERLPLQGPPRNLARMDRPLVHPVEHRVEEALEGAVAGRAPEPAELLEVVRRESALLAPYAPGRVRVERRLQEEVGERKTAWIRHSLGLGAFLAQVHLVHLVVQDLGEVHRGGLRADVALERVGHE